MSPNREKRNRIHAAIERERYPHHPSFLELQWLARDGQLLDPRPAAVDDSSLSHRFGPVLKTVQMERVKVEILTGRGSV